MYERESGRACRCHRRVVERPDRQRRANHNIASLNAAVLVLFTNAVVSRCLGCVLVICGVAEIVRRVVESTDWTWLLVSLVLKVAGWL